MDGLGLDGKTNFFEQRTTEYARSSGVSHEQTSQTFMNLDDDF